MELTKTVIILTKKYPKKSNSIKQSNNLCKKILSAGGIHISYIHIFGLLIFLSSTLIASTISGRANRPGDIVDLQNFRESLSQQRFLRRASISFTAKFYMT